MSSVPNATTATTAGHGHGHHEKNHAANQRNDMYLEPGANDVGGMPLSAGGRQFSVTLSPEQFEQLYLQPAGIGGKGDLSKRFGNPTPLGIAGFLLCLTPLSIMLMNFGNTNGTVSPLATVGAFFGCGGTLMIIAGIMEWVLGNTFPFVVFSTFGGFWLSFAILLDPQVGLGTAGTASAASASAYYEGIAVYAIIWGVMVFIYLLGSMRTNVTFVLLFFTLDIGFFLLGAAYLRIGEGRTDFNVLLKTGGAFLFVTTLCGWWIMLALILGSTAWPVNVPLGDLSGFLAPKNKAA